MSSDSPMLCCNCGFLFWGEGGWSHNKVCTTHSTSLPVWKWITLEFQPLWVQSNVGHSVPGLVSKGGAGEFLCTVPEVFKLSPERYVDVHCHSASRYPWTAICTTFTQ